MHCAVPTVLKWHSTKNMVKDQILRSQISKSSSLNSLHSRTLFGTPPHTRMRAFFPSLSRIPRHTNAWMSFSFRVACKIQWGSGFVEQLEAHAGTGKGKQPWVARSHEARLGHPIGMMWWDASLLWDLQHAQWKRVMICPPWVRCITNHHHEAKFWLRSWYPRRSRALCSTAVSWYIGVLPGIAYPQLVQVEDGKHWKTTWNWYDYLLCITDLQLGQRSVAKLTIQFWLWNQPLWTGSCEAVFAGPGTAATSSGTPAEFFVLRSAAPTDLGRSEKSGKPCAALDTAPPKMPLDYQLYNWSWPKTCSLVLLLHFFQQ